MTPMNGRGAGALKALGLLVALAACGGGSGSEPNSQAPSGLSYDLNPAEYVRGAPIAPNALQQAGGDPATSFSVSPALPAGLAMDPATGRITGTPTAVSSQATYTVTAENSFGSATVGLRLSVRAPAGRLISGTVSGEQPGVSIVQVYRTPANSLLAEVRVPATGLWSVEGAESGTYRIDILPVEPHQASYKYYPASRSVTVSSSDVPGQNFCIAEMDDRATICKVTLSPTRATIGGDPVSFAVDIVNWGTPLSNAYLNIFIEGDPTQGEKVQGCGTSGQVPTGACTATGSFSVPAYWDQYPGEHQTTFELRSNGLLSSVHAPITLVE